VGAVEHGGQEGSRSLSKRLADYAGSFLGVLINSAERFNAIEAEKRHRVYVTPLVEEVAGALSSSEEREKIRDYIHRANDPPVAMD